jgi:hypothetical protein
MRQFIEAMCATESRDDLQQFGTGHRNPHLLERIVQLRGNYLGIFERFKCPAYEGGTGHYANISVTMTGR